MPFLTDYLCYSCEKKWEELLDHKDDVISECPFCKSKDITRMLGGTITTCHDPQVRSEKLKKRSEEHTRKLVQKQAGHKGSLPSDFGRRRG
jgi:DNA-directed RNA polymerase subunit RPC12/RpoP